MKVILNIFIFALVLFLYLHIIYHMKVCNDLELIDIENYSKDTLEEICDLRQPVRFLYTGMLLDNCFLDKLKNDYLGFDVNIRNYQKNKENLYNPISLKELNKNIDNGESILSENNFDFLEETSLIKYCKSEDSLIRPYVVSSCNYDLIFGNNINTILKYNINYRNFFLVIDGEIDVKLTPPKNIKYLDVDKDFDLLEFRSNVDPWNTSGSDKVKYLDLTISKNQILFIPAYWFYSFKFKDNAKILSFCYRTFMNTLAISPFLVKQFLEKQNVPKNILSNLTDIYKY